MYKSGLEIFPYIKVIFTSPISFGVQHTISSVGATLSLKYINSKDELSQALIFLGAGPCGLAQWTQKSG